MMDVANWVKDLPPDRISALKPVYKEMKKAYLHDSIDGLERFHQKKVDKLEYHQRLYNEHQEKANHWFDTANKLQILQINQESVDTARHQAEKETEYASYHLKFVNTLWDQVGMLTEVIDHYQKTSVLKAWFVISGQPDDDDEFAEYFGERLYQTFKKGAESMAEGKVFPSENGEVDQQIPDWMIDSNAFLAEFDKQYRLRKATDRKVSKPALHKEMNDIIRSKGIPKVPYDSFKSLESMLSKKGYNKP